MQHVALPKGRECMVATPAPRLEPHQSTGAAVLSLLPSATGPAAPLAVAAGSSKSPCRPPLGVETHVMATLCCRACDGHIVLPGLPSYKEGMTAHAMRPLEVLTLVAKCLGCPVLQAQRPQLPGRRVCPHGAAVSQLPPPAPLLCQRCRRGLRYCRRVLECQQADGEWEQLRRWPHLRPRSR